jgi:hypothetical protein
MSNSLNPKSFFGAFDIAFFVPGTVLLLGVLLALLPSESGEHDKGFDSSMHRNEETSSVKYPSSVVLFQFVSAPESRPSGAVDKEPAQETYRPMTREQLLASLLRFEGSVVSATGFAQLAVCIVAIYVLGLATHFVAWTVFHPFEPVFEKSLRASLLYIGGRLQQRKWGKCVCSLFKKTGQAAWINDRSYHLKFVDYFWYLRSTTWNTGIALLTIAVIWIRTPIPETSPATSFPVLWTYICILGFLLVPLGFTFGVSCRKARKVVARIDAKTSPNA